MRVLFEICHPAHVHYFRNLIKELQKRGHDILILAQDRGIISELLKSYGLEHQLFSNLPKSLWGKLLYIPLTDLFFFKEAKKFKPDILLGFAGAYISHIGWLLKKAAIVVDDTEHANLSHFSYKYFASSILTPSDFNKNFGKKHIRFNGSTDLAYLHPNYFLPNKDIYKILGISENENYILMRFVSWHASHDIGQTGVRYKNKIEAVKRLSLTNKIFISSENELPRELKKYELNIPYNKIHDVIYYANLFWGDSGTMATEAAILGTPAINVSSSASLQGVFTQFINEGLLFVIPDENEAIEKAIDLLKDATLKYESRLKAEKFIRKKIDLTTFLVWFLENFPNSFYEMQKDKNYFNKYQRSLKNDK